MCFFTFTAHVNETLSLRINNQAYNPEVISSGTFSSIILAVTILGGMLISFANFFLSDFLNIFIPFMSYFLISIIMPLPIYITNSALRMFTLTSIKEMFSNWNTCTLNVIGSPNFCLNQFFFFKCEVYSYAHKCFHP